MARLMILAAVVVSFFSVDRDFRYKCNYQENHDTLLVMLESAFPGSEKAEVYWRLSRASLMLGEEQENKAAKRQHFTKGIEYAELGMKENSTSKECYMWHCANIGRDCQTRSIIDQAAAVPKMMKDLTLLLDKYNNVDYSEAWQALSEIYYNHPMKSDEAAINYARKAATCVPSDELRISTYTYLAKLLHKRNWSAGKRENAAADNVKLYNGTTDSNIEKYAYFDGSRVYMPWSIKPFTSMSDREEAAAIVSYAKGLYNSCKNPTPLDNKDLAALIEFSEKNEKVMTQTRYAFNYSQDIVHLQTKYSLFKRVANILFSVTFEKGYEEGLMTKAIELLIERNDCLRIRCEKKGKENLQYFREKCTVGKIPTVSFASYGDIDKFVRKFRKGAINVYKGETFKPVFAIGPNGEKMVFIKISHLVADTYGIGILVNDLYQVYNALAKGEQMPPMPGQFEEILKKDAQYRANDAALEKDRAFFKEYYEVQHSQMPAYCGIHGIESDSWLKLKRKGYRSLPYLFVKCDTRGYKFVIPAAITEKVEKWCNEYSISMNSFFFYTCAIACSLRNDKLPYQLPLELMNCRGTIADKKAAGTKVQSLSVYTTVDYTMSFVQNILELFKDQTELYRHTKLSFLEVQDLQHNLWKYSMMSQLTNFCFSFIPVALPNGISFQLHSNGKGALPAYMALMLNTESKEIYAMYDIQTKMCSTDQMIEFQNTYVNVMEKVLERPELPLSELF